MFLKGNGQVHILVPLLYWIVVFFSNRITDLPAHFGQLRELTRLNLSGNNLRYIPSTLLLSTIPDCNGRWWLIGKRERERERGGLRLLNLLFVKGETNNYENTCKSYIIMKKQNYMLNARFLMLCDFTVSDNDFISSHHSIKCVPMVCKIPPLLELSARAIVHNNPHDKLEDLPQSLQGE